MGIVTRILFPLSMFLGGLEPDGLKEAVERCGDPLIELVKLRELVALKLRVSGEGLEQTSRERRIDPFKEFEKHQADAIALRQEPITPGVRQLLHETVRAQLGQLVA